MSKDTLVRVLSAMIGLVVYFVIIFSNGFVFDIALGAVILFMLYEFLHSFKYSPILIVTALFGAGAIYTALSFWTGETILGIMVVYTAILAIESVFFYKKISFANISATLFATFYITIFTLFIGKARTLDEYGIYYLCLIFACAWMSDTGAYFIGRFFGKRKLAPDISPKKTIAGSIGGIIFAIIGALLLGIVAKLVSDASPNYIVLAFIGAIASFLSQLGDLVASLIKRSCNIKDFGNIMPGHGGMLDRFDSVIMAAPFIYYTCAYFYSIGLAIL